MTALPVPSLLLESLKNSDSFIIIPHKEPDGDCISSALGLESFLRGMGKKTLLANEGPFEKREIRDYEKRFVKEIPKDFLSLNPIIIVVDCSTLDRIGALAEPIKNLKMMVIDHHSSGIEFGDIRYINTKAPSCSLLILEIMLSMNHKLTKEEAELLFFGFCTDTGFFRHLEDNSAHAFELVAKLISFGANPKKVFSEMNGGASLTGRIHLGNVISRTESFFDGKVLVVYETEEETKKIGRENRESDLIYQLLMGTKDALVVIALRQEGEMVFGGLRSKHTIDVGALALQFGGGGHARASGLAMKANLDQAKESLLEALKANYNL